MNLKKELKSKGLKLLKIIIVITVSISILWVILSQIIKEEEGRWDSDEKSPKSYRNNYKVTAEGVEIDKNEILDDALKTIGYSEEKIEKIRIDLEKKGYTGEELEKKIVEEKLKILGLDSVEELEDISPAELIWLINEDLYDNYLENYEQLEYLMNAELVTKMPYLNNIKKDELNGTIYFERHTVDNKTYKLEYIDEQTFNEYKDNNNEKILKYFTIVEEGKIRIAYYKEETGSITVTKKVNGYNHTDTSEINVNDYDSRFTNDELTYIDAGYETRDISYNTIIPEKYSMPFEYLWAILVASENYEFVEDLAELAYDSEIVISIYDNLSKDTIVTEYNSVIEEIMYSQIKNEESYEETVTKYSTVLGNINDETIETIKQMFGKDGIEETTPVQSNSVTAEPNEDDRMKTEYTIKKVIDIYTNLLDIKLTYANVWIMEYTTEYSYYSEGCEYGEGDPISTEVTPSEDSIVEVKEEDVDKITDQVLSTKKPEKTTEKQTRVVDVDRYRDKSNS